jgi:PKD repeat protein/uncharacterized protein YraI
VTNYWNEGSSGTKVIIVAVLAILACGLAALCVLGLGLLGVYQLPGSATPAPEVALVEVNRVAGIVVVVPTPVAGSPSAAVVCRVDILSGPGEGYDRLGVLEEGRVAEVTGISQNGDWWVIKVAEANTTQGWVSAQCLAVESGKNVAVVPPPPTPIPTPPPPVAITGWQGEYFNNRDLQGEPVLVRDDPKINFDWGTGSPAPEVPPDNFSARWTISRDLPAGTYRFNIWADDGVRMWIDDVLIVNGWVEGGARNYVVDVNLSAGLHNGRVEYFEAVGNAMITLNTGAVEPPPPASAGPPQAVISGPTEAQVGQPVAFSAGNSGVAPGSQLTAYDWAFGDGSLAQGVDVTHIYANPGDYQVTLTVVDDKGLSNSAAQAIKIVPAPAGQPPQGPDAAISAPGQGVVGQPVTFDGSGSSGPNPIVTYRWGFGDGSTANAVAVQKTYDAAGIYNVTLRVTDDQGLENEDTWQITIGEAPAGPTAPPGQPPQGPDAAISAPSQGVVGQPITFDGSGSSGPNPIVTYRWGFGDGSTANAVAVQKTYEAAGIYNVILRVTDDQGLENEDTWQITIVEAPAPGAIDTPVPEATATPVPEVTDTPVPEQAPPSAALEVSPPSPVQVGQAVTFDAGGSLPGSSPIASYEWDFGDGSSAAGGPQETHQYSAPGTYTATVTVVDANGMSSSASQQIDVGETEPTPESTS